MMFSAWQPYRAQSSMIHALKSRALHFAINAESHHGGTEYSEGLSNSLRVSAPLCLRGEESPLSDAATTRRRPPMRPAARCARGGTPT